MAKTLYEFYTGQGQKLPSLTERAKTYESAGLGSAATYRGTAEQNTSLLNYLKTPQQTAPTVPAPSTATNTTGSTPKVVVPETVNASALGTVTTSNFPTPAQVPEPDPFISSLEASTKQIQEMFAQAQQPVDTVREEQTGLRQRLLDAIGKLGTKGTSLQAEEEKLGIPQDFERLKELNLQTAQLTGEFNKAIEGLSAGTGLSTTIAGKQGQLRRQQAVEIGALTSVQQALAGNLALSQQTAQRTVDLEFEPLEAEIQQLTANLDFLGEDLTSAEKKAAEQLRITLDERTRLLEEAKTERTNVLNFTAEAAKNGAPNDILTKMSKAKTVEEAMNLGGEYLAPKPTEFETKMQDLQLEEQTLRNSALYQSLQETVDPLEVENKRLQNLKLAQELGLAPIGNAGATADLGTFMTALAGQESGGDYNAQNGRTSAFGKFQIMPGNWPNWSREAGLPANAPQTPENQEKVAAFKISQYYQKYGNWADVASVWYSGRPLSQVEAEGWADKPQGPTGAEPSVREYVNSVLSKLPKQTIQLKPEESRKVNKEIVDSGAYKAIVTAQSSKNLLNNYEKLFKQYGNQRYGDEATELKSAYQKTLLNLKEFFNLGVLNGPDLDIMRSLLIDPTEKAGLFFKGGEKGIQASIDEVKKMLDQHLEARYTDLMTSYQDYDKSQLTNLQNADRAYQQIKAVKQ